MAEFGHERGYSHAGSVTLNLAANDIVDVYANVNVEMWRNVTSNNFSGIKLD